MKLETRVLQTMTQQQKLSLRQQQDLKILEMNTQDLHKRIEEELETNPMLEFDESYETGIITKWEDPFSLVLNYVTNEKTLTDVLQEQIDLYPHKIIKELAEFIIQSLDDNGYLTISNKEIQQAFQNYSLDDIEDTIQTIQTFEPLGVCARNLQECILIQLCTQNTSTAKLAICLVNDYLQEIAENKLPQIAQNLFLPLEDIVKAVELIRSMNPKPGEIYAKTSNYIVPDIQISVEQDEIHIYLLRKTYGLHIPSYTIEENDSQTNQYIQQQKKQAEQLLSSIHKRNSTLEEIMRIICTVQKDFFLYDSPLKPLTLKMVAEELKVHESTISRAISEKYIVFEGQIYSLKTFFPNKLQEETSTSEVQSRLKHLISQENKKKPYSDQKLCDLLNEEGYNISRRTVAKYRDLLHIPPASKRKQF